MGGGKHHAQCLRCHGWQGQHHHPFYEEEGFNCIDITDTGKGITPSKFKTVFNPGYSTKQRGWGLGLSLAKRIIEEYHKGKIFVKSSKIDVGTTFCIKLKNQSTPNPLMVVSAGSVYVAVVEF